MVVPPHTEHRICLTAVDSLRILGEDLHLPSQSSLVLLLSILGHLKLNCNQFLPWGTLSVADPSSISFEAILEILGILTVHSLQFYNKQ